ncbi:MAG TPA: tRNA (adenosine(37)-N6)-threonylcarbamoyltransferase complex ATPase subunit type 1 TsaE [Abditibacteriaceae bacterium]
MISSVISTSSETTRSLGNELGTRLQPGDIVFLSGDLGAGKTTFTQGVAASLGIDEAPSPTYVLIIEHNGTIPLLHLDAYRLEGACFDAVREAGIEDFFGRDDAVRIVEWPEFVADWVPSPHLNKHYHVRIEHGATPDERRIDISPEFDRTL